MAIVKCKECGSIVSTTAKACPTCGAKPPRRTSMLTWIVLAIFIFFGVKACVSGTGGSSTPSTAGTTSSSRCSEGMAHTMATNFVRKQLQSPSTAKFPGTSDDGVTVRSLGECKFDVTSYVDSQNVFGATVRSRFWVQMESNPEGTNWRASDLVLE